MASPGFASNVNSKERLWIGKLVLFYVGLRVAASNPFLGGRSKGIPRVIAGRRMKASFRRIDRVLFLIVPGATGYVDIVSGLQVVLVASVHPNLEIGVEVVLDLMNATQAQLEKIDQIRVNDPSKGTHLEGIGLLPQASEENVHPTLFCGVLKPDQLHCEVNHGARD
jgi:hypothetical protein